MGRGEHPFTLNPEFRGKVMNGEIEDTRGESEFTLADIYASEQYGGKAEVSYEYDLGDGWEHQITFLGRADPSLRKAMQIPDDMEVFCLGGEVRILSRFPFPCRRHMEWGREQSGA